MRTKIQRLTAQLLLSDGIRRRTAAARYHWYTKILRRPIVVADHLDDATAPNAPMHAKRWMVYDFASGRSTLLLRPLSVLPGYRDRLAELDTLAIGPRTEGEILNFVAHGFTRSNIRSLDLISYSPWITTGDMHNIPWPDDTFDVVTSMWCITYSETPERCIAEMVRVARPGAAIGIGVPHESQERMRAVIADVGYVPGATVTFEGCDHLLSLFPDGAVKRVLYRADPAYGPDVVDNIVLIVQV